MKNIMIHDTSTLTVLVGLILMVLLVFFVPIRPQMWVYPLVRQATLLKINYETRDMAVYETEHFKIKYTKEDATTIDMIAKAAEAAYDPVTKELQYTPHGKTLLIVQPSKNELRQAFGWSGSESAMGVYWGGAIQLLSPRVWLSGGASVEEFIHSGPMVHEYTHLVFDYLTSGNYPRWFTEGLAQYVEYRVNHYEWQTPTNNLDGTLYTMAELEEDFDQLPNQSLAYRQSLAAVRFIAEVYGEDKLNEMIKALKAGQSMESAIKQTLALDSGAFEQAWQQWAVIHMKRNTKKN